jgi:peptidoglycan hydrolase-like protein with peptidoglycan-binding domain
VARWIPVAAAGGLLAIVVGVGLSRGDDTPPASAAPSSSLAAATTTVAGAATNAPAVATVATSAPVVKVPLDRTLGDGVTGDDVRRLQTRLAELGFDPGPVDGRYGGVTIQSVWAFEKLVMKTPREEATGRVTPEMWDLMQDPIQVQPRRPSFGGATHVEVYLPEQVLAVFTDNRPVLVAHISSGELDAAGNPAPYCDKAVWDTDAFGNRYPEPRTGEACATAKTPGGVFEIHRMELGNHRSALGGMTNPVYFNYGIAIHGADNVPLKPASHGCVRINQYLATYFQELVAKGDKVLVWGHDGQQPEEYSEDESLPHFDQRIYDTTTTTSTTTTSTTTTVPTTEPVVAPTPTTTPVVATSTSTTSTVSSTVPPEPVPGPTSSAPPGG